MLEKLLVQNFQAHYKRVVEFDERVTTIVGASDVGKSAIIRALRWVCLNQPQGEGFIKSGQKGTTVQLFVDGQKVTRRRGKGINSYLLNDNEFKAFGNNVPQTIAKSLNVHDINFQSQIGSPFWFDLSAGEVSRQLNQIVDLTVIDDALTAVGKKVRYCQSEKDVSRSRLDKVIREKNELKWVLEADTEYADIDKLEAAKDDIKHDIDNLVKDYDDAKESFARCCQYTKLIKELTNLVKLGDDAIYLAGQVDLIKAMIQEIKQSEEIVAIGYPDFSEIMAKKETLEDLEETEIVLEHNLAIAVRSKSIVDRGVPDISDLQAVKETYEKANQAYTDFQQLLDSIIEASQDLIDKDRLVKDADKELQEYVKDQMCPICQSPMLQVSYADNRHSC